MKLKMCHYEYECKERCGALNETWSFNVANTTALLSLAFS